MVEISLLKILLKDGLISEQEYRKAELILLKKFGKREAVK